MFGGDIVWVKDGGVYEAVRSRGSLLDIGGYVCKECGRRTKCWSESCDEFRFDAPGWMKMGSGAYAVQKSELI